jgi:RNA polymerase sigma-70 factor (ECF subfamily)
MCAMTEPDHAGESVVTCWTLIQGAAAGEAKDRETFALLYEGVLRAYLGARWRDTPFVKEIDDAVQDVFYECFKDGGALGKAEPGGGAGGFRAFLHKVTNHVAGRIEEKRAVRRERQEATGLDLGALRAEEAHLSEVFDRAWMHALLDQAVRRHEEQARARGEPALRRVALLRLRFEEGVPIREIARRWEMPADRLHHDYATARDEFKRALQEVLAFHHPSNPTEFEREFVRIFEQLR